MSERAIIAESDRAAKIAARKKRVPYIVWPRDVAKWPPFPFPNIGSYRPKGYKLVDTILCDNSGFGSSDERALTAAQLKLRIKKGFAYAIIEEGQFQILLGEFELT